MRRRVLGKSTHIRSTRALRSYPWCRKQSTVDKLLKVLDMRSFSRILLAAFVLLFAGVAWSGDFKKGWDAYSSGDYATALTEWQEKDYFEWYGTGWGDNQTPFEEGKVAIWLGSSGSFGGLAKKDLGFEFSATFLPYWESVTTEPKQTFIGGAALFAMSGQSDEENAATAKFFEFLSSAETQVFWHKETGYVPITEAAYDAAKAEGYYEEQPAAEVGIKQLSLDAGENTRGYRMGFYVQIRDVMNREYGRILTGETSVEDAFKNIEMEANQLLERFSKTQG